MLQTHRKHRLATVYSGQGIREHVGGVPEDNTAVLWVLPDHHSIPAGCSLLSCPLSRPHQETRSFRLGTTPTPSPCKAFPLFFHLECRFLMLAGSPNRCGSAQMGLPPRGSLRPRWRHASPLSFYHVPLKSPIRLRHHLPVV